MTLKQRMRNDLELRGLSPRTREAYLFRVTQFARYFNKLPDKLGEDHVKEYLLHLIHKKVSYSVLTQTYSALKFIYEVTLKRTWDVKRMPYPKTPKRLPSVLDKEEVKSILSACTNLKHRTILMLIYSAGLRISEAIHLKPSDIDTTRMTVMIPLLSSLEGGPRNIDSLHSILKTRPVALPRSKPRKAHLAYIDPEAL